MHFLKSPFVRKFFIVQSLIMFLGVGSLTVWTYYSVKTNFEKTQLKTLQDMKEQYKENLLGWLAEKKKDIEGLSKLFFLIQRLDRSAITVFRQVYPEYVDVLVINKEGRIVLSSGVATYPSEINLSDREYFKAAMEGRVYSSGFFRGRSQGVATLSISAPVYKDGKPEMVVAGFILLDRFLKIFSQEVGKISSRQHLITIHLINTQGQVISNPLYVERYPKDPKIDEDPQFRLEAPVVQKLVQKTEGAEVYTHNGREYYGAYAWVDPLDLGLLINAEASLLEESLYVQIRNLILASLLMYVSIMATLFFIFWKFSKPVAHLMEAMEQIIRLGKTKAVPYSSSGSMMDILIEKFNQLQEKVEERETKLKDQAARDPLTGLYNHGTLKDFLEKEFARRKRSGKPMCFLMADIDHFKDINDNYGHLAGDQVLREVSRILESCVREGDVVARYGGEEFAVFVDSEKAEVSQNLAERIRQRVESHTFTFNGVQLPITVSVGWACVSPHEVSSHADIVREADDAMYRAKQAGRNKVCGFHEDSSLAGKKASF